MATIKPIEGRTVHQIQSGQVIIDICSVVKELVENGLDAGATSIEVRFKNQGLESIEVLDNGSGITKDNYETIALKHYTSKLSSYADLETLNTFGFRGEALSSLCALSQFTITTCLATDVPKGTKLEFETSGKLKGTSVVAAQKGTIVSVENLFKNLPVRRRELERNIKREWTRVNGILGAYACMQTGIKFSVTSQAAKGKKTTVFSTKGNPTTRENIANVFGAKTLAALLPLDLKLELELTETGIRQTTGASADANASKDVRITGHVSRPVAGEGRQLPDRQMFFVNSRPCQLPQFAKAFNEVYRTYNIAQSPFIFANIELDTHLYDVNVSPDKRTILLHDQNQMLEKLKESLTDLFEVQDYTLPASYIAMPKLPQYRQTKIVQAEQSATQARDGDDLSSSVEAPSPVKTPEIDRFAARRLTVPEEVEHTQADEEAERQSSPAVTDEPLLVRSKSKGPKEKLPDANSELVERFRQRAEIAKEQLEDSQTSDSESRIAATHDQPRLKRTIVNDKSRAVRDFNSQMARFHSRDEAPEEDQSSQEEPIPSIAASLRRNPAGEPYPSQRTARPRTQLESATITIGDHTVTSSLRSPHRKRQRLDEEPEELGELQSTSKLRSGLFKRFGAGELSREPSPDQSSITGSDSEVASPAEDGDDDEDNEDDEMELDEQPETAAVNDGQSASAGSDESDLDDESFDEDAKKTKEEAKVAELIEAAEAPPPSQVGIEKTNQFIKGPRKREMTYNLTQNLHISLETLTKLMKMQSSLGAEDASGSDTAADTAVGEEKLSLTIDKGDFAKMHIVGQFNLGFILATRPAKSASNAEQRSSLGDELFIIDQHASDEKYNFERLQATTILQPQHLVQPKTLSLTAVEEEIVLDNRHALESNGFQVTVDESGDRPVGQRCQLVSLPLSRETTFTVRDLEELLGLLAEHPGGTRGTMVRPSKTRKMFAMRACRSSIMIGRTLTPAQMATVVTHMGELDKPWNCPHGRPTMRHLCGLDAWDEVCWREGDVALGERAAPTDWAAYLRSQEE